MFYHNLSGTRGSSILTSGDPDLALFPTLQGFFYSSGNSLKDDMVWVIDFSYGLVDFDNRNDSFTHSWAVHDGNIGAAVGGSAAGVIPRTIRCDNKTTRQRVRVPTPDDSQWDCEVAGLKVKPGDKIRQIVVGTADGTDNVGGSVTGVDANKVRCYNLDTDRSISIRLTKGNTTWDCEAAGLRGRTGDEIRQAVQGRAE